MFAAIFLAYGFVIWLVFDKLRLIRLSLPIAIILASVGPLLALYLLVSMNNHHPSSADARVFQRIVQITPQIAAPGRVQEISVVPNTPVKKSDALFKIDPRPYEFEVHRLEAALAAAIQSVPQLQSSLDQASAAVAKANAQYNLAREDFGRQRELFDKQVIAQATLDRAQRNVQAAEQAVAEARAFEERTRLAAESKIGSDNTAVAQVKNQLAEAKFNLEATTVRAPCDGYVTNLQLVPGALVSSAAAVMPFVCDRDDSNAGVVVATFMQGPLLNIHEGDYAEVVFPMFPGQVFPGKVLNVIDLASQGQLAASGLVPGAGSVAISRFPVRIRLDDGDKIRLPAGAQGSAAVFTGKVQIAGVLRMALMRFSSWTNYLYFTS